MVANGGLGLGLGLAEASDAEGHCGEHCPFLNRSDHRCADKLRLDHIDHAFDYCFGDYKACPVYLEQLAERRVRRLCGLLAPPEPGENLADNLGEGGSVDRDVIHPGRRPVVQLTVSAPYAQGGPQSGPRPHRYSQHAAGSAGIPASPRL